MDIMKKLEERARNNPRRICFPESGNSMIVKAAQEVVRLQIGTPVLIGNPDAIKASAGADTAGFVFFDNTDEAAVKDLASRVAGIDPEISEKSVIRKSRDAVFCAMYLAKAGMADCVAAGREYTTGDVLWAGMQVLGTAPDVSCVSSIGILNVPGFEGPEGNMLVIGDCAVNMAPDAEELAGIAIASADTVRTLLEWEPRIAMLAFSTDGSADHESIKPIKDSIGIVRERRPDIKIDGEFQLDAAIKPEVAASKVKRESDVAGKANILIFPNLHAGNIGVKLIQTFGKADAYGPVLQGFKVPICDFSRGAPLSEIMGNVIMLLVRAGAAK